MYSTYINAKKYGNKEAANQGMMACSNKSLHNPHEGVAHLVIVAPAFSA